MDPFCEAIALMFTKIFIHIVNTPNSFTERTYAGINQLVVARRMSCDPPPQPQESPPPCSKNRMAGTQYYEKDYEYEDQDYSEPDYDNNKV